MMVKNSFYNELVPIEEADEYLIYNLRTGGLSILDTKTGAFLKSLGPEQHFSMSDHPENVTALLELKKGGFLVPPDLNEKALHFDEYAWEQKNRSTNTSRIALTIGTTILCNMGCSYCFQTVRPNKSLRDEKIIDGIVRFVLEMIKSSPGKKWEGMSVTWFGGEPLVNKNAIEKLTEGLYALCLEYDIPYEANIITNGILLDRKTWRFLRDNHIFIVQITIDGAKEIHDNYRPLKTPNVKNYETILENISVMPADFSLTIRINTDKRVAASLDRLLADFRLYGLWPQRHSSISLTLAWLKAYKGADVSNMINLTHDEFFEAENMFAALKAKMFNEWAKVNKTGLSKIKWRIPERQTDCPTWVSPYFFAIDPDGGVHKCWETLHDKNQGSGKDVLDKWEPEDYKAYTSYSRTTIHPTCYNCKFNPVCEGLTCAKDAIDEMKEAQLPCTPWKTNLPSYFKRMYLEMRKNPAEISLPRPSKKKMETHANK